MGNDKAFIRCTDEFAELRRLVKSPNYGNRWKAYPLSCLGHTLQGLGFGLAILSPNLLLAMNAWPMSVIGCVLAIAYIGYKVGSGARKIVNRGHSDSIGLGHR